jgi:hypothetical protein
MSADTTPPAVMNPHKAVGKCGIDKPEGKLRLVLCALSFSIYPDNNPQPLVDNSKPQVKSLISNKIIF